MDTTTPAPTTEQVDRAWNDAYLIAWVGASNPQGVARTMAPHRGILGPEHPAVKAISGHLAFLHGHGIGPEFDELDAVRDNGVRLGICDSQGNYIPESERAK